MKQLVHIGTVIEKEYGSHSSFCLKFLLCDITAFNYRGTAIFRWECPPPNWKVGCSIHGHRMNRRSAPWLRALTSTSRTRIKFQSSACRQTLPPQSN